MLVHERIIPDRDWLAKLGLRDSTAPTLLYGSHARRNTRPDSDVDVLQLAMSTGAYSEGLLSVTTYRPEHLQFMMTRGSLFGLHLQMDGVVLFDPTNELSTILESWRMPLSYAPLMAAIREVSGALDVDQAAFQRNVTGYIGLAVFLARTEVYSRCAESGEPEFDMPRATYRCGATALTSILGQGGMSPSWASFYELRQLIREELDVPCTNPHGSLEGLVVRLSRTTPVGAALVLRVLAGDRAIRYHGLPMDHVPW